MMPEGKKLHIAGPNVTTGNIFPNIHSLKSTQIIVNCACCIDL